MAKVLLLHGKTMSVEAQLAMRLIARRRDAQTFPLADDHPLLIARSLPALRRSDAEIFHAFGNAALGAAVIAGGRRIVFTPSKPPSGADAAWLRATMRYRSIDVVCQSDTLRKFYVTRGVPVARCHLVRPGVPMTLAGDRAALREQFGFAEADRVLFAPMEATHDSDHLLAMWAASLLNLLDPRFKLLVWGVGPANHTILDFQSRLLDGQMLRLGTDFDAAVSAESLFAAADAVLLTARAFGQPTITALAMASGKPIVSTTTAAVCEMIEDRHTALLTTDATPRQVAQRVIDLFEDDAARWKLADRARAEAYDYFAKSKALAAIDAVYAAK